MTKDNNKTKLNNKKIKEPKQRTEEGETIHNFIITFGAILLIVLVIYLVSILVVNKRETNKAEDGVNKAVEIDYNLASVGTILNRPYDEYYVIVYDRESDNAIYYSALMAKYQSNKDNKKHIYYTDLSESINSSYKKDTSNPKATNTSEFAFGEVTLLEINKGKISRYIEDIETIKEILQ